MFLFFEMSTPIPNTPVSSGQATPTPEENLNVGLYPIIQNTFYGIKQSLDSKLTEEEKQKAYKEIRKELKPQKILHALRQERELAQKGDIEEFASSDLIDKIAKNDEADGETVMGIRRELSRRYAWIRSLDHPDSSSLLEDCLEAASHRGLNLEQTAEILITSFSGDARMLIKSHISNEGLLGALKLLTKFNMREPSMTGLKKQLTNWTLDLANPERSLTNFFHLFSATFGQNVTNRKDRINQCKLMCLGKMDPILIKELIDEHFDEMGWDEFQKKVVRFCNERLYKDKFVYAMETQAPSNDSAMKSQMQDLQRALIQVQQQQQQQLNQQFAQQLQFNQPNLPQGPTRQVKATYSQNYAWNPPKKFDGMEHQRMISSLDASSDDFFIKKLEVDTKFRNRVNNTNFKIKQPSVPEHEPLPYSYVGEQYKVDDKKN